MGKKRHSAKTGDRALYKKLEASRSVVPGRRGKKDDDDENMYDDVDKYHNQYGDDFLKLDNDNNGASSEESEEEEAVMDLGVGGSDSDEDDDESSNEEEEEETPGGERDFGSSEEEDDESEMEAVRDWGQRKASYYHGDTADLEIGQDEEDAFLEEAAVREVQASRYEEMDEEDFLLSDAEEEDEASNNKKSNQRDTMTTTTTLSALRDVRRLPKNARRRLLEKQHPELLPILSHFSPVVEDLAGKTMVATSALLSGNKNDQEAVGTTPLGREYLFTKALLQTSTALNLAMFLLLKSEEAKSKQDDVDAENVLMDHHGGGSSIQSHPVLKRLEQWDTLTKRMRDGVENKVDRLDEQVETLAKAYKLMESGELVESDEDEDDDEDSKEERRIAGESPKDLVDQTPTQEELAEKLDPTATTAATPLGGSEDEGGEGSNQDFTARNRMNDANFGLRPNEVTEDATTTKKKRRRRREISYDFGDEIGPDDDDDAGRMASRSLSSTINRIEQRSSNAKGKKMKLLADETLHEPEDDDDELRRGLQMMEAELGRDSDDMDEGANEGAYDDDDDEGLDDKGGDDEDGFYAKVAKQRKSKKDFKKSLYQAAPKYPSKEDVVEGERKISRVIMKNRGLVAHKNKLNRNPRVKKREQYRKALIRRKGAVREIRTEEGHKYGGETTGIKSRVSRSRKLGV